MAFSFGRLLVDYMTFYNRFNSVLCLIANFFFLNSICPLCALLYSLYCKCKWIVFIISMVGAIKKLTQFKTKTKQKLYASKCPLLALRLNMRSDVVKSTEKLVLFWELFWG